MAPTYNMRGQAWNVHGRWQYWARGRGENRMYIKSCLHCLLDFVWNWPFIVPRVPRHGSIQLDCRPFLYDPVVHSALASSAPYIICLRVCCCICTCVCYCICLVCICKTVGSSDQPHTLFCILSSCNSICAFAFGPCLQVYLYVLLCLCICLFVSVFMYLE